MDLPEKVNEMEEEEIPEVQTSKLEMGNVIEKKEIPEIQMKLLEKGKLIGRFAIIVFCAS